MATSGRRRATRPTTARLASASTLGTLAPRSPGRRISRPRHHDARATSRPASTPRAARISSDRARTCASRGRSRRHALSFTGYRTSDSSHTVNVTTTNPLDQPFLPYLSFESDLGWAGLQVKDAWNWSRAEQPGDRLRLREGHERRAVRTRERATGRRRSRPTATSARPASTPRTRSSCGAAGPSWRSAAGSITSRPRPSTRRSRPTSRRRRATSPSSIPASASSTSWSRTCARTSRSGAPSFPPRR